MRWPLRRQIMLPLLAVAVASLAAVGGINARLAVLRTRQRIESQLQGVVTVLSTTNFPLSQRVLKLLHELSSAEFIVSDDAGAPLAASLAPSPKALPASPPLGASGGELFGPPIEVNGVLYFHRQARLAGRAGMPDAHTLHVLSPQSEYQRALRQAFWPPVLVGAAAMIAVAAAAHSLAGRISRAASHLGDEVLRMARGDFSPATLPPIDDELRDLSQAVNRTASMLADYEQQVRRGERMHTVALLGAGIAHEMRNAATGCRIALDLHAQQCDGAASDESLSVAKRQLRLMETQLQRFLRAGKESPIGPQRNVDLASLVDDLLPLVKPAARHAGVDLAWSRPDTAAEVRGDPEALGQAVLNLALNAIEAVQQPCSPTPRRVTIELEADDGALAELTVSDNGPGPTASADQLFEPFVTSKPEGIGLGLAVARQAVEAHHGTINWARTNGWTQFRVALPLASENKASCLRS